MGKNSLIKSTSKKTADKETDEKKKKAAAKPKKAAKSAPAKEKKAAKKTAAKKTTSKKTAEKKTAAKKTAAKKSAPKKTAAKSKETAKTKTPVQKAAKPKTAAKKKTAPKKKPDPKKPASPKEILFRKFDTWTPESLYSPPTARDAGRGYTAPPMISADSADEEARLKSLLFRSFSEEELKAAGEKAAAKLAEAEKKKAEAEKAAEEKAAAAKTAKEKEPETDVSVSYPPPPPEKAPADPMEKAFKYGIAGFVVLLVLLVGYSFANTGNYYIESANGGLKIYQGRFAPLGKELMITLPGVSLAEPAEAVYSRSQVYPLIYQFYLDRADALLAAPGLPDYEGIRRYTREALKYATSGDSRSAIYTRLDGIELMTLLYKADVAASKNTVDSLEEALDYLNEASRLEIDDSQAELIDQKREAVRARIEQLKAAEAAAQTAEAPNE